MISELPLLSLVETRVLGTLFEKQHTVPDTYPLSFNALVGGCNQKTSRNPVLEVGEAEALAAIDRLRSLDLVVESSGSRVARFAHNLEKGVGVGQPAAALLTVLMLRGPQTAGELRLNCERLYRFADISSVEAYLAELAVRSTGALTVELPRLSGARENRWAHCLSGEPLSAEVGAGALGDRSTQTEIEALKVRVAALEADLAALRVRLGD